MLRMKRELLQRVTITGPMAERGNAFAYCEKHGLRAVRIGPPPLRDKARLAAARAAGARGHVFDATRFKLVAEGPAEAR